MKKDPLSENMSTRLRMYKVLLFKFRRHLYKGSITSKTLLSDTTYPRGVNWPDVMGSFSVRTIYKISHLKQKPNYIALPSSYNSEQFVRPRIP